jgi:hypothetical protein
MSVIINGDTGVTTPGVVNTAGETIATTLSVTGVTTLTGGLNAALPVLSGGTGVTTKTGTGAVVLGTSPTLATPTFDSAQLVTISGTAPLYMCRAWVNFNGTGTVAIRASGNVSSITDNGTGDYTVNFTTAMPDANYMATQSVGNNNYGVMGIPAATNSASALLLQTTTQYRIYSTQTSSGTSNIDAAVAFVAIFR